MLKFPEIQAIVNDEIWRYIYENKSSYTKIAEMTNLSKARFSELKKTDALGRFVFVLSESVLDRLIGRNIVSLEAIKKDLVINDDTEEGKAKGFWLKRQEMLRDLESLQMRGFPIKELIDKAKEEAGIE